MKSPQEYFYFLTLSLYFTDMLQKKIELIHECYLSVSYNANRHFNEDQTIRDQVEYVVMTSRTLLPYAETYTSMASHSRQHKSCI